MLAIARCWGYKDDEDSHGTCPHGAGSLLGETHPKKLIRNDCVNTHNGQGAVTKPILVVQGGV